MSDEPSKWLCEYDEALARIKELEAQVKELEAALRPFSKEYDSAMASIDFETFQDEVKRLTAELNTAVKQIAELMAENERLTNMNYSLQISIKAVFPDYEIRE